MGAMLPGDFELHHSDCAVDPIRHELDLVAFLHMTQHGSWRGLSHVLLLFFAVKWSMAERDSIGEHHEARIIKHCPRRSENRCRNLVPTIISGGCLDFRKNVHARFGDRMY